MNEEPAIRNCLIAAALFLFCTGCADQVPPGPASPSPAKTASDVEPENSLDPRQILDRAITALGGPDARKVLRRGYVKLTIEGEIPGVSERLGRGPLTFEAWFDLPEYERREIYGALDGDRLLIITNSGTIWLGDQNGKGSKMRAPPPEVYKGPLLVSILTSLIEIRDTASKFEFAETDIADPAVEVIDVIYGSEIVSRISFNKQTHFPTRIEKRAIGLMAENLGEPEETVTTLAVYRKFGSTNLPTDVAIHQRDQQVVHFLLESADFDTPVDQGRFLIPE